MGITDFSVSLLNKIFEKYPNIKTVAELGDQNLYTVGVNYGKYANIFYEDKGLEYICLDANGGNNALKVDLSKLFQLTNDPLPELHPEYNDKKQFDLVTDFGVSEHIKINGQFDWEGIYNCWLNKHNLLKVGGITISENPKTKNWNRHGYNYYTEEFYKELVSFADYEIIELGEVCAMGNCTDGKNIYAIMQKKSEKFATFEEFKTLDIRTL